MELRPISIPAPVPPATRARDAGAPAAEAARPHEAADAPALQDLLTPAEREFFARLESLGPLTYRPGAARAAVPAAPTGQRLDVRG